MTQLPNPHTIILANLNLVAGCMSSLVRGSAGLCVIITSNFVDEINFMDEMKVTTAIAT